MTIATGVELAETITKNPAAGEIVGYAITGIGTACVISGIGLIKVSRTLLIKNQ